MTAKSVRTRILAGAAALSALLASPAAADHLTAVRLSLANRLPSTDDAVALTVSGASPGCPVEFVQPPAVAGRTVRIEGATIVTIVPCPPSAWSESFTLPPLPVGGYTVEVWIDGTLHLEEGFAVQAAGSSLSFHEGAFTATAHWSNPYGGGEGEGHAIHLGDDSGAFWFFDPGNVEVTIKLLDGRKLNGHFWVFIANMSTVEFEVTVTECPTGPQQRPCTLKVYRNPPFENRNFLDTAAF